MLWWLGVFVLARFGAFCHARSFPTKPPSHQATTPCPGTTRAIKLASALLVKAWRKSTERRRARSKPPRRLCPPSEQGAGYHHAAHSMGPARKQSRHVAQSAQSTRVAIGAGATASSRSAIATVTATTASCRASDTKTLSSNTPQQAQPPHLRNSYRSHKRKGTHRGGGESGK